MTETKAATKTTEFFMVVAAVVGILVSAMLIKGGDTGGTDEFIARQAWLYVAILVGAYAVGRGLAKSGSPEPYTDDDSTSNRSWTEALPGEAMCPSGSAATPARPSTWRRVGIAEHDGRSASPTGRAVDRSEVSTRHAASMHWSDLS